LNNERSSFSTFRAASIDATMAVSICPITAVSTCEGLAWLDIQSSRPWRRTSGRFRKLAQLIRFWKKNKIPPNVSFRIRGGMWWGWFPDFRFEFVPLWRRLCVEGLDQSF
jgi:hypothetical protein